MPTSLDEWAAIATIVATVAKLIKDFYPRRSGGPNDKPKRAVGFFAKVNIVLLVSAIGLLFYMNSNSILKIEKKRLQAKLAILEQDAKKLQDDHNKTNQTLLMVLDSLKMCDSLAMHSSQVVPDSLYQNLNKKFTAQRQKHKEIERLSLLKIQKLTKEINSNYLVRMVASNINAPCFLALKKKITSLGFKVETDERAGVTKNIIASYAGSDSDRAQYLIEEIKTGEKNCTYSFGTEQIDDKNFKNHLQLQLAIK